MDRFTTNHRDKKMLKKFFISVLVVLSGCGGGGGSSSSSYQSSGITGVVQKGPLIYGSYVNAYLLDEKLNPTGQSYVTQTTDDLGNFKISSNISSSLIRLVATGYYFDEVSGALSASPTTLSAIVDLTVNSTPTINVLTTLQAPRVEVLLSSGKTYSESLEQSAQEVLAVFGVDTKKIDGYKSLYGMQINGNKDADAVLLATSTVLAKMSSMATENTASSQAAQLSYFLSRIASDIANYGTLKTTSIQDAIKSAQIAINLTSVRSNVENYYASRNVALIAPKFEEWIDKPSQGILPLRYKPVTGLSFSDLIDVEAKQIVSSNETTLSGLGLDEYATMFTLVGSNIVKNQNSIGTKVELCTSTGIYGADPLPYCVSKFDKDIYSLAKNNDQIKLQTTSGGFGETVTTTLNVGSTLATWKVSTRSPTIEIVSPSGCGAAGYPGDNSSNYHALPVLVDHDFVAKYIGVQMQGTGSKGLSIYSDNSGLPGTKLLSSKMRGIYFAGSNLKTYSGVMKSDFNGGHHYYLGADGIALTNNKKYWIVVEFSNSDPGAMKHSSVPNGYRRKVSSDGSNWTNYAGQANCRYDDQIPEVWISN